MPGRYQRSRMTAPVVTNKEILDGVFLTVAAGVTTDIILLTPVQNYVGTIGTCPVGARLNGIYLFLQISPDFESSNVDWYLVKLRGGQGFGDTPIPGATGGSNVRNQILHEEKGIPGETGQTPPLTFRGFLAMPKIYKRSREGDNLAIRARSSSSYDLCFKCIYKWIT